MLIGSLFVFIGIISLSWPYLLKMKDEVFSDMLISMSDVEAVTPVPEAEEVSAQNTDVQPEESKNYVPIDYSKYLGVLEIPKIRLKRGFYNIDSKYNNIQYNVTLVKGSNLPDVVNGNLILMAHSGDAYISYFAYLYKLNVGDYAYVTYAGNSYTYQIVNIYNVPKNGLVSINRNKDRTTLTMITCTKDDSTAQTVYIAELV